VGGGDLMLAKGLPSAVCPTHPDPVSPTKLCFLFDFISMVRGTEPASKMRKVRQTCRRVHGLAASWRQLSVAVDALQRVVAPHRRRLRQRRPRPPPQAAAVAGSEESVASQQGAAGGLQVRPAAVATCGGADEQDKSL
jgi:hypothetical protein